MEEPDGSILVTSRSFSTGTIDLIARLREAGYTVHRASPGHDLADLGDALRHARGWIAGTGPITDEHLAAAPRLRVIARYGVGIDAIDRRAAARRGIPVTNTPGANAVAVADHTMALLLAALRGVVNGDAAVRAGQWGGWRSTELHGAVVGVVGLGRIGREVVTRLRGFGCDLRGHDPYVGPGDLAGMRVQPSSLTDMARECDVVSLHAPGGRVLIDQGWLAASDRPVILVNTARGDLVDEAAVGAALRSGRVGAYAADTLRSEGGASESPLLAEDIQDRVTLTPHVAAQTVGATDRMGSAAVENLLAVLEGRQPPHLVSPPDETDGGNPA